MVDYLPSVYIEFTQRYGRIAAAQGELAVLLERERILPRHTVLLSWQVEDKPKAPAHHTSIRIDRLGPRDLGVVAVDVTLGYLDRLDVMRVLARAAEREPAAFDGFDATEATFFVSEHLDLPRDRTVIVRRDFALGATVISHGEAAIGYAAGHQQRQVTSNDKERAMAACEVCGNEYDKSFQVVAAGETTSTASNAPSIGWLRSASTASAG
jgi:hypothetical protein